MKTLSTQLKLLLAGIILMIVLAASFLLVPVAPALATTCRNAVITQKAIDRSPKVVGFIGMSVRTCWGSEGLRGATVQAVDAQFIPSWKFISLTKAQTVVNRDGAFFSYTARAANKKLSYLAPDAYTAIVRVTKRGTIYPAGVVAKYGH